jgi:hypothetical protein
VVRLVVARLVAEAKTDESLSKVSFPSGRIALVAVGDEEGLVGVRLRRHLPHLDAPLRHRHRARERPADEEAVPEDLAHVPHLVQVASR